MTSKDKKMKVQMVATGTIKYPDGTEKEIILRAERPLTEGEIENGDNLIGRSDDSSS